MVLLSMLVAAYYVERLFNGPKSESQLNGSKSQLTERKSQSQPQYVRRPQEGKSKIPNFAAEDTVVKPNLEEPSEPSNGDEDDDMAAGQTSPLIGASTASTPRHRLARDAK